MTDITTRVQTQQELQQNKSIKTNRIVLFTQYLWNIKHPEPVKETNGLWNTFNSLAFQQLTSLLATNKVKHEEEREIIHLLFLSEKKIS